MSLFWMDNLARACIVGFILFFGIPAGLEVGFDLKQSILIGLVMWLVPSLIADWIMGCVSKMSKG